MLALEIEIGPEDQMDYFLFDRFRATEGTTRGVFTPRKNDNLMITGQSRHVLRKGEREFVGVALSHGRGIDAPMRRMRQF